ncbi:hypothetical protein [Saccharopolyspora tripterygii]
MTTSSNNADTSTGSRATSGRTRSTKATATSTGSEAATNATSSSGDSGNVMFTAEGTDTSHGVPKVASASDYPDSRQVTDGDWNPETHGEPPDTKPARNF